MTKVLISILNWNGAEKTLDCVQSLQHSILPDTLKCDVRVVDNGSGPDQVETLRTRLPSEVELVLNPVNTGFTGGQNLNIRHALAHNYDYVFLLNNDTVVATMSSISGLSRRPASQPTSRQASRQ